ncbi:hypothetical protein Plhal304r1_c038g0115041 [Plasmopara halstedii]
MLHLDMPAFFSTFFSKDCITRAPNLGTILLNKNREVYWHFLSNSGDNELINHSLYVVFRHRLHCDKHSFLLSHFSITLCHQLLTDKWPCTNLAIEIIVSLWIPLWTCHCNHKHDFSFLVAWQSKPFHINMHDIMHVVKKTIRSDFVNTIAQTLELILVCQGRFNGIKDRITVVLQ